jgi:hypothetical protein
MILPAIHTCSTFELGHEHSAVILVANSIDTPLMLPPPHSFCHFQAQLPFLSLRYVLTSFFEKMSKAAALVCDMQLTQDPAGPIAVVRRIVHLDFQKWKGHENSRKVRRLKMIDSWGRRATAIDEDTKSAFPEQLRDLYSSAPQPDWVSVSCSWLPYSA